MTALVFSGIAGDWPQWGGPNRDHISKEAGLLQKWPEGGPKRIWLSEKGGVGYAGFSVVEGQLFTMGARDGKEQLLAFGANDGKELWAADLGDILKNDWGDGPRGTPTVDGDRVYALGGKGKLVAASVKDGKILWTKSLTADLGGKVPGWGYTESVLVEGGVVYCTPGGSKGTIAALDKMTGELKWQSSEVTEPAHYSSIVPTDLNGSRQLIQLTEKQLTSVNAKDGKLLWKSPWPGRTAVIPTPVVSGNQVYITTGYGVGSKLVKVDAGNKPSDVFENKVMKNHHGGVCCWVGISTATLMAQDGCVRIFRPGKKFGPTRSWIRVRSHTPEVASTALKNARARLPSWKPTQKDGLSAAVSSSTRKPSSERHEG